jgi:co-chaperonin GroES (HSP10)
MCYYHYAIIADKAQAHQGGGEAMIYYVLNDDLVALHKIELNETERIAANERYSILDEDTVLAMIKDGAKIVLPEEELA